MPKIDDCDPKRITFNCTGEEPFRFITKDSCKNFLVNFHIDECIVIKNGTTVQCDEDSHCHFISTFLQERTSIEKKNLTDTSGLCLYQIKSENFSDKNISCDIHNCKLFQIVCSHNGVADDPTDCNRNRLVWIVIYGIVLVLSFTFLTLAFRCYDVISADLCNRHNSEFGKERLWSIFGSSAGPSVAGLILEQTTSDENAKNYAPIFIFSIILTIISIVPVWKINPEFHEPAADLYKKSLELVKKYEITLFFLLLLIAGLSFEFQLMFGNWYLQNLGGSDLLIGISKGISTLVGLPLLYVSKWIYDKTGVRHFFLLSLLCYVFYSFAFSLMREPWLAMVFELANTISYLLFWPAVMLYCEQIAPLEMQATIKVFVGILHFSMARIGASMIGGFVMDNYGGRVAFQVIGFITLGYATMYGTYLLVQYLCKRKLKVPLESNECETAV